MLMAISVYGSREWYLHGCLAATVPFTDTMGAFGHDGVQGPCMQV